MSGGVQRIWGSRNYDVRASLQLGGGGGGAGTGAATTATPPAAAATAQPLFADGAAVPGEGYTPEKAVAELVALNPHASAIGLSAQDITRELPVLGGGGGGGATPAADARAQAAAAAPALGGNGTLQVFDSDDDDDDDEPQEQQQQQQEQQQQPDKAAAATATASARKRRRPSDDGNDDDGNDDNSSSRDSQERGEEGTNSSSSDADDDDNQQHQQNDDEEAFISLGAAAEQEALLERQAADEARRAADEARRAAVEGRAFGFRPPWLLPAAPGAPHALPRSQTLRLHNELVAFARMLEPTPAEAAARCESVERVREAVRSVFPSARLLVFGSYATGLYVPTSDIDLVVVGSGAGKDVPSALRAVAAQLQRRGLVRPGTLNVIAKARVPIVKFEMAGSGVAFDVSFDVSNGPRAARHVARLLRAWPPLRPLVLALKVFLHQRELNEVYTGGIGSYALIVMAASALQLHASRRNGGGSGGAAKGRPVSGQKRARGSEGGEGGSNNSNSASLDCNLGALLIDFFRLYGRTLNVERVGVTCDEGGLFIDKATAGKPALLAASAAAARSAGGGTSSYSGGAHGGHAISTHLGVDWRVPDRPFLLAVRDPLDPGNDVARNSWNVQRVRAAFDFAYQALTAPLALPPVNGGGGAGGGGGGGSNLPESLLGRVIHLQPVLEGRPLPRWPEGGGVVSPAGGGGGAGKQQQQRVGSAGAQGNKAAGSTPGSAPQRAKKKKEKARQMREQQQQQQQQQQQRRKSSGGGGGGGGSASKAPPLPPSRPSSGSAAKKKGGKSGGGGGSSGGGGDDDDKPAKRARA